MPTETAITIAAIGLVFVVFGGTLALVDFFMRDYRAPGVQYFDGHHTQESSNDNEKKA
jgi:hypothetical protein